MRFEFKNSEVCLKTVESSSAETLQDYLTNFINGYPGISPHVFEDAIKFFVERSISNIDFEFCNEFA
jgi:hypothetical protein